MTPAKTKRFSIHEGAAYFQFGSSWKEIIFAAPFGLPGAACQ